VRVRLLGMSVSRRSTRRASLAALTVVALSSIGGCSSNDDDSTEAPSGTTGPPAGISADAEFEELERCV
jgi:hypothetical protein